jgi:hypothetical protein
MNDGVCVFANPRNVIPNNMTIFQKWYYDIVESCHPYDSREEVLALEDAEFQLQQRGVLSPRHRLSTIMTLPILWSHFLMPPSLGDHPTCRFGKIMPRNLATPMAGRKNKWENATLMDGFWSRYHFVSKLWINIISKEDITYKVRINDIPHCTCMDFTKHPLMRWKRKGYGYNANILIICLDLYARWITRMTCSFTHLCIPTTRLCCRLVGVVECE